MRRRDFIRAVASAAGTATLAGCAPRGSGDKHAQPRMLLVAFDGLDPRLLNKLMAAGRLPNFARLSAQGSMQPLQTTTPPHTPVAFSTVITGTDPATHGVFDFIHRDPAPENTGLPVRPYFSTSEAIPPTENWSVSWGDWQLPLSGGGMKLLRQGAAFWDHLSADGVATDVYYVPANFPCNRVAGPGRIRAISGMGTPDLLGTHGEFTFYSSGQQGGERMVSGGCFLPLRLSDHAGELSLPGPVDALSKSSADSPPARMTAKISVRRDPRSDVVLIRTQSEKLLLNVNQWSEWLPLEFVSQLPGAGVWAKLGTPSVAAGMVRVFVRQVHPQLELYVSPVNLDPLQPAGMLSQPPGFASELAARHGRFYTQGIPEDTKAFSHGALPAAAFVQQSGLAYAERTAQWRAALAEFDQGCLFFYFGSSDLMQHMFWRDHDPDHPGFNAQSAEQFGHMIPQQYEEADARLGEALQVLNEHDTIIAFSDHGFTSFRQGFNLNSWLVEQGLLRLANPGKKGPVADPGGAGLFAGVDWAYSDAYGLGMNGLYLNLSGREKHGRVKKADQRGLLANIKEQLLQVKDDTGRPVIDQVDLTEEVYPQADRRLAPDLILGYADGFRASWETVLGGMPEKLIVPNLEQWSGEHLISARLVPGVLVSNRKVEVKEPHLRDIAPTVLQHFGTQVPREMTGRPLFVS